MGRTQLNTVLGAMAAVPAHEARVLLATGRYLGSAAPTDPDPEPTSGALFAPEDPCWEWVELPDADGAVAATYPYPAPPAVGADGPNLITDIVCAYRYSDADAVVVHRLDSQERVYEYLDGWAEDISGARTFDELPPTCQAYVRRLEALIGCRISGIGVGPGREQSVAINDLI